MNVNRVSIINRNLKGQNRPTLKQSPLIDFSGGIRCEAYIGAYSLYVVRSDLAWGRAHISVAFGGNVLNHTWTGDLYEHQ